MFPAEPSWVTFKALLLPPEGRKDDWSERERPRVVEVDLTVQNWEKELLEILSVDYSDLTPEQKVRTAAHARATRAARVHMCQCTTACVQAKQKPKSITFSEATLVYSGRGPVNHRASTLAQCIVRGHALLNFGGFKGKSFHSLLRPGTTPTACLSTQRRTQLIRASPHAALEYVKSLGYPLSSDVWTLFGRHNAAEHNEEVHKATIHLQSVVIPKYVALHAL